MTHALLVLVLVLSGCGRLAFDPQDDADAQTDPDALDPDAVIDIAAGGYVSCALRARGDVYCWGTGAVGRLGVADPMDRAEPGLVPAPVPFVAIDVNDGGACGLVADGTAWCWGGNDLGQFGLGTSLPLLAPTQLSIGGIAQLAIGFQGTCLRLSTGRIACAGRGDVVGDGTGVNTQTFVDVVGVNDAVHLAMGEEHACVLDSSGTARCWGTNTAGHLGDGTMMTALTPVSGPLGSYDEIHLGDRHTCARAGGSIECWGQNLNGELGDGTFTSRPTAAPVMFVSDATSVAATAFATCALRAGGTVVCWGNHEQSELGNGSTSDSPLPVEVPGLTDVVELSGRTSLHLCARTRDGAVYCWGDNYFGQAGGPALGTDVQTPGLITFP